MNQLAAQAKKIIEGYKSNKTIMDFVTNEALEKTAQEIREIHKGGTTAKGVQVLMIRHKSIAKRVDEYINLGLIGCYIAAMSK